MHRTRVIDAQKEAVMNAHETSHDGRVHTAKIREEMQALPGL